MYAGESTPYGLNTYFKGPFVAVRSFQVDFFEPGYGSVASYIAGAYLCTVECIGLYTRLLHLG